MRIRSLLLVVVAAAYGCGDASRPAPMPPPPATPGDMATTDDLGTAVGPDLSMPDPMSLTISPPQAKLGVGQSLQLSASEAVTWTVTSGAGTIDANGNFTAGTFQGVAVVTAETVAAPARTATATLTVEPMLELVAGGAPLGGSADGVAATARFLAPGGLVRAPSGIIYVADTYNSTIRAYDPVTLAVTTVAGRAGVPGDADGGLSVGRLRRPTGLALDSAHGQLYIADPTANTVRVLDLATSTLATVAGANAAGFVDGPTGQARFSSPTGLVLIATLLYVTDTGNDVVRVVDLAQSTVSTLAGAQGAGSDVDGPLASARFVGPTDLAAVTGGLVLLEPHRSIRIIDFVGATVSSLPNSSNGSTLWYDPSGVGSDGAGTVVLCDRDGRVRQPLQNPAWAWRDANSCGRGLALVGTDLYDLYRNTLRISQNGAAPKALAGAIDPPTLDGQGAGARLSAPQPLQLDSNGGAWFGDAGGLRHVVFATGQVQTVVKGGDVIDGTSDQAAVRLINSITRLGDALYFDDFGALRKLELTTGVVSTLIASTSTQSFGEGQLTNDGTALYSAAMFDDTVQKVSLQTTPPTVAILAGSSGQYGHVDGTGGDARFQEALGIAYLNGALYVMENGGLRKVDPTTAEVTTVSSDYAFNLGSLATDGTRLIGSTWSPSQLFDVNPFSGATTILLGSNGNVPILGMTPPATAGAPQGAAVLPSGDIVFCDSGDDYTDPSDAGRNLILRLRGR